MMADMKRVLGPLCRLPALGQASKANVNSVPKNPRNRRDPERNADLRLQAVASYDGCDICADRYAQHCSGTPGCGVDEDLHCTVPTPVLHLPLDVRRDESQTGPAALTSPELASS
ncbi:hypothetical protein Q5P01_020947 [Channa striata]|uniref:Uncharacterized protein n=1 Tax=Channa striata TaxID=64152 RepID=A0AA88S2Y4_CHASR|nr:hypothetical protein Q5P01_020947 [Channa striata]